ncbi:MAG: hypothetical protein SGARI_001321 [Bacillariaceae sp.]
MECHDAVGGSANSSQASLATVRVVGCPDEKTRSALESKLLEKLDVSALPEHVTISCESLEEYLEKNQGGSSAIDDGDSIGGNGDEPQSTSCTAVYLSPDADESLDPSKRPPLIAVVGLLIDRRVQPNRSKDRASKLDNIVAKRWPLEECFVEISAKEPLNVDCVLEGMQQWWWNCNKTSSLENDDDDNVFDKECFLQAASQAIEHHAKRHPSRPLHLSTSK